ncbi:MAG: GntR family transcriptional regulator [Crocinitomicaceae bacterium]|jgi:uncharacterized protein|nr:GntR family transcriptional regulator [Crocinitomicaceae bacterium]MCF8434222.1 GntR family transcriptional regulator [Crocinitomicaceae bacterium]MDP4636737.1 S1-like domain-containing RNA-binding protein [Crocinitomicaceae bacterium]MDP4684514.1 S1-like domain-containing RNA-binding protein [Crocinitomicaceae bacterium]MDP4865548.1 S1-like domain-containing RNA-binding protein [Crocinitomicaceae bacterium]
MNLGTYNELTILRFTSVGAYLGDDQDNDVLLPNKYLTPEMEIGNTVIVFLYKDSEDRLVATTEIPFITLNEFRFLKVKEVTAFGAFMDWGLEKDLMVPFKEQMLKLEEGRYYLTTLQLDGSTDRLFGSTRVNRYLEPCDDQEIIGQEVDLLICDDSDLGVNVIVEGKYRGLIYHNDVSRPVKRGDHQPGFVYNVREDGKLDVRFERADVKKFDEATEFLLEKLKTEKVIQLSDKSDPDDIRDKLHMSKKMFKQAIGKLYKARLVTITDTSVELIESSSAE